MSALWLTPRRLSRLLVSDARNVSRDPTLLSVLAVSVLPAVAFGVWHDSWNTTAERAFGLSNLGRYLQPVLLVLPSFLLGWVMGFLLLEDRDDGPLLALEVTPVGKGGFFAYRAAVTALATVCVSLFSFVLVVPQLSLGQRLLCLLLLCSESVATAFILLAAARNKVEGLAVTKLTNLLTVAPLLAAVESPVRYLGGVVPTFWIGEVLRLADQRYLSGSAVALAATACHLAWAAVLYRIASRRVG